MSLSGIDTVHLRQTMTVPAREARRTRPVQGMSKYPFLSRRHLCGQDTIGVGPRFIRCFCCCFSVNGEFVSAVTWRQNSPVVVAANSQGTIKVLELV